MTEQSNPITVSSDNMETITEDQFVFLNKIMSEYEEAMLALNSLGDHTVTFYGGSRVVVGSDNYKAIALIAEKFG